METESHADVPSPRHGKRRYRHIPATRAEMVAWMWGAEQTPEAWSTISTAMFFSTKPPNDAPPDVEAAFERLSGPRFWRWADAGFRAALDESEG